MKRLLFVLFLLFCMERKDQENFQIKSGDPLLDSIPSRLNTVYMQQLFHNNTFNETYNKYKRRWFKKVRISRRFVGIWGWNSWCGIHGLTMLVGDRFRRILRNTIDVGFQNTEPTTGLLPHAVLHNNDVFASQIEFKCYSGKNGEAYNLDNIICWAKMAMEYYLATADHEWFESKLPTIETTINYILEHFRSKFNDKLIEIGIEGDWTECTNWELDNANVNVNMIEALRLLIESIKPSNKQSSELQRYQSIRTQMIEEFNKDISMGGFWHPENHYFIHGNDGTGKIIHGDKYFESTANYFALLWNIANEQNKKALWDYINSVSTKLEFPYPVLTNLHPRTGARRQNYGFTVTNGDVWMVLGAHAAAARMQAGFLDIGSKMYRAILEYEKREGVLHNCIYFMNKVNDTWDPEIANYGALYVPFVFGILGAQPNAEGLELNIKRYMNIERLDTYLYFRGSEIRIQCEFAGDNKIVGNLEIKKPNSNIENHTIDKSNIHIRLINEFI